MALESGTQLGPYRINAQLGAGGMGEVYAATDTRLERAVAIKVLPEHLASDASRRERFEREARAVSSLNHPHICTLYDVGEQDGTHYLVMELIEGETLESRLEKGRLPLDQTLEYALDIADAMDKAHRRGVVHRDLKPGNIMLTKSGVKLLDFGLAKLRSEASPSAGVSQAPTLDRSLTAEGTILGTLQYMAPEQLEGQEPDARTDIFAFGAVVYEMVTGQKAFRGKSQASLISSIMSGQPRPVSELQTLSPPSLDHVISRCLAKDPDQRWQTAADLMRELAWAGEFREAGAKAPGHRPRLVFATALAGIVAGAVITGLVLWNQGAEGSAGVTRLSMEILPGTHLGDSPLDSRLTRGRPVRRSFALSPDGRTLVYVARLDRDHETAEEGRQLYIRRMGQDRAVPVPGTEGGQSPFFSPDGQSVGFFKASGELMRFLAAGGEVRTITTSGPAFAPYSVSWAADDTILVATDEGLFRVPAGGGMLQQLTEVAPGEPLHGHPEMLPGARAILFNVGNGTTPSEWDIVARSLDTGEQTLLVEGGSDPSYVASGHIVFVRDGALMAVPFDAARLEVLGDPVIVIEDVMQAERGGNSGLNTGDGQFTVSESGTLAYVPGGPYPVGEFLLNWVGSDGVPDAVLPAGRYLSPRFSPDGTRLAYEEGVFGDVQIWIYDIGQNVAVPLTSEGEHRPVVWSPDGTQIAFSRGDAGSRGIYVRAADGSGSAERLTESEDLQQRLAGWSDGLLVFLQANPGTGSDIMTMDVDGEASPEAFLATPFDEIWPALSPDGQWLAYVSNETGANEVYVRPFPEAEPAYRISTDGGVAPLWSPDGERLYYRTAGEDGMTRFMTVDVTTEPAFTRSQPRPLFEGAFGGTVPIRSYDIAPDGERFVMLTPVEAEPEPVTRIRIVENWIEELKELVPVP